MHLFFENVAPHMYSHWSKNFFKETYSNDDYVLSKSEWEKIGKQMDSLKNEMSSEIGRPLEIFLSITMDLKLLNGKTG
jgi:hypothetical protein